MGRWLLAVWVLLGGCVTTRTEVPIGGEPIPVQQLERFRVFGGDKLLGHLKLFNVGGEYYYRVETPTGIWVGDVQRYGRFFKPVPFEDMPRDLGVHTMNEGLGLLFETDARLRILPMEGRGEPTEAAARKLLERALDAGSSR